MDTDLSEFLKLTLDGKDVATFNYTTTQSSTIITLKESYLKTFGNGTYAFVSHFTNGTVNLPITIAVPGASGLACTGDNAGPLGITALAVLAGAGVLLFRQRLTQKQH